MLIYTINYNYYYQIFGKDEVTEKPKLYSIKVKSNKEIDDSFFEKYLNDKLKAHWEDRCGKIELLSVYYENTDDIPSCEELLNLVELEKESGIKIKNPLLKGN
jgi:hypothetical protein